jgi:predicted nuclease with TOPRIM domain
MVLYICNKCNKNFSRKQSYQAHINRKYSCILTENFNTNLELEENNKQYEENNKELTDRIKNLEKDKDILKEENFTMKVQIKEKQDLLNNKDIEIKDLYKNMNVKNNNNNDIKIKLVQEYVYIIRECDFVRLNEDIYKIGRTSKTNPEDRFQKYRKGTEIVAFFKVNNSIECENKMIKCFSNHINIKKMSEYGKEYFQGNRNELLSEILKIVINYNT